MMERSGKESPGRVVSPRMSKISHSVSLAVRNPANKLTRFYKTPSTKILLLRGFLVLSLLAAAVVICLVNYTTLSSNERKFASSQYKAIAAQALNIMLGSFSRMRMGTLIMAKDYQYTFPNITMWPLVALPGYTDKAVDLAVVSSLDNLIFTPAFTPAQAPAFEAFMHAHWASDPYYGDMSPYPGAMGVWGTNNSLIGTPGFIYHDTTGRITNYLTKYPGFMEATFQFTFSKDIGRPQMGYNCKHDLLFGPPLDEILDCVAASANLTSAQTLCAFFSNIVPLPVPTPVEPMPETTNLQAYIFQPILLQDPSAANDVKLVGIMAGAVNWKTLLSRAVPSYVDGLDCVVRTDTQSFTYAMEDGEPVFKGVSDLHDPDYSRYAKTVDLLQDSTISAFTSYKLTFYPRRFFFDVYQTDAPLMTTIGAICIILFCSCVFAMYDTAISRESSRKEVVLDTKRRFVRFISHEIRTPMNTVSLGLKLLEMEIQSILKQPGHSAQIRDAMISWIQLVDDIHGNGDCAVDVLNDLLNYDKIESGTLRLEFSTVDIWTLVKKTAAAFVMQAKQKNIELQLIGDCWSESLAQEETEVYGQLRVIGDATRIAQVLRNLLSNALKFTPENGTVIVQASWVPNGLPYAMLTLPAEQTNLLDKPRAGSVKITVTDSGAGLSDKQLAQICTEGTQFNANQLQAGGGSGLGLFISKGLAEQHGGDILVSSDGLGKGSTFRLELPLFRHDEENFTPFGSMRTKPTQRSGSSNGGGGSGKGEGVQPVVRRLFSGQAPGKVVPLETDPEDGSVRLHNIEEDEEHHQLSRMSDRPRRILVVDDATSNRKLLMRILKAKGYVCDEAEDGQKGLDLYVNLRSQGEIVDAILMDFEMPVMDGPTATKRIRELGCNCFIVGVTGNLLPADIDLFRRQGANQVLAKPLNVDVFETTFKAFKALPDTDQFRGLLKTSSSANMGQDEFTAKLHPLGGAGNV